MNTNSKNALSLDTVRLSEDHKEIIILDQTLLPGECRFISLRTGEEIWEAIYLLRVRGAPAIGVTGAYGYYILSCRLETEDKEEFVRACAENMEYLNSSRPTAVNLSWALNRMHDVMLKNLDRMTLDQLKERLREEADAIYNEDVAISRSIGRYGFELLEELGRGTGIMTHCNAGTLATAKYGTALAPVYIALEEGWDPKKDLHVYCDETRPLLQGARLSAFEMQQAGVDTYVQCDNMASYTMKSGKIGIIFVGCDRVAANGDFANKIGTSGVAILAKHYGIPFYTLGPTSTIDMSCASGADIRIEERNPDEIKNMWYKEPMALNEVKCFNPAFDVTDHELLTAIVTDQGIIYPPFDVNLKKMFG